MIYNGTPIKSMNIKHYEISTNDATMKASDLQSGVTAYAKGKKITGTGKSFEFAYYGGIEANFPNYIPSMINVVEITSTVYPIKANIALSSMRDIDFSTSQIIGSVIINNVEYPITSTIVNNFLTLSCDESISLQIFYGKDNYV